MIALNSNGFRVLCRVGFAEEQKNYHAALVVGDKVYSRVRIAENVPLLRVDYCSVKSRLPGVWSLSHSGECDLDFGLACRSSHHTHSPRV